MTTVDIVANSSLTDRNTFRDSSVIFPLSHPSTAVIQDYRETGSYPDPKGGGRIVEFNNKLYSFGGYNGSFFNDWWEYDLSTQVWTKLTPTGATISPRYEHSMFAYNSEIYVFGGWRNGSFGNDLYKYNPSTNVCTALSTSGLPTARQSNGYEVVNGHFYIFGGLSSGGKLSDVSKLNLSTLVWSVGIASLSARTNTAAAVVGTDIFIYGGDGTGSPEAQNDLLRFDTISDIMYFVSAGAANSPGRVRLHGMFEQGNYIYGYGGRDENGTPKNTLYRYDSLLQQWDPPQSLLIPTGGRSSPGIIAKGFDVYIDDGFLANVGSNVYSELWKVNLTGFPACTVTQEPTKVVRVDAPSFSKRNFNITVAPDGSNITITFNPTSNATTSLSLDRLVLRW